MIRHSFPRSVISVLECIVIRFTCNIDTFHTMPGIDVMICFTCIIGRLCNQTKYFLVLFLAHWNTFKKIPVLEEAMVSEFLRISNLAFQSTMTWYYRTFGRAVIGKCGIQMIKTSSNARVIDMMSECCLAWIWTLALEVAAINNCLFSAAQSVEKRLECITCCDVDR